MGRMPLLLHSAESESLQKLIDICGHIGLRACTHDACNRLAYGSFTGVARKAWTLPVSGPLRTVAMPEICPRSLILLAMVARRWRLESLGNRVLRSVNTPS